MCKVLWPLLEAIFVVRTGCVKKHLQVSVSPCEFHFISYLPQLFFFFFPTAGSIDLQTLQSQCHRQSQQLFINFFTGSQYYIRSKIKPLYHITHSNFVSLVEPQVMHSTSYYLKFTNKVPKCHFSFWKSHINRSDFLCIFFNLWGK